MSILENETIQNEEFSLLSSLFLASTLLLPNRAPEKLPKVDSVSELRDVIVEKCIEAKKSGDKKLANYYDLMQSTIRTESDWNRRAFNPKGGGKGAVGLFQIRMPVIKDVNRRYNTNYKIEDAYDINKAAEIYRLYYNIQSGYLKSFKPGSKTNIVDMAKMYNQGCNVVTKNATEKSKSNAESYWKKIKSKLALKNFGIIQDFDERLMSLV